MTNNIRQKDADARKSIISDIDTNFFVEAGAGSGKTTVLVERMVAMVENGRDISKICAITFTKAAANEFYARFQSRLIERATIDINTFKEEPNRLGCPTEVTKQRCRDALNNIDLAFMGTIDSFCNMVMSEHPSEGGIPSDSAVISDEEANKLYKKFYARIMNGIYGDKELSKKADLFLKYNSYPENVFVSTLKVLLSSRDCEIQLVPYTEQTIDVDLANNIKIIRKIIDVLYARPEFFKCAKDDIRNGLVTAIANNKYLIDNDWEPNITSISFALKEIFTKNFCLYLNNKEIEEALQEGMDYFEVQISRNKPVHYVINAAKIDEIKTYINNRKYAVTLDFVNSCKEIIIEELRKKGKLTFSDYLIYLRDTLREDARNGGKLIKKIYERHSYFMIDEFQDTDPIQAEIFFYLAAKDIKPKWSDCIPYGGSLFIVGDPKQSIYRFKNADVASFLKVKKLFSSGIGQVIQLYCNFRSTLMLREYFNSTFSRLFVENDEQAEYPEIPTDNENKDDCFTGIFKYDSTYNKKEEDAESVADMILKMVHKEGLTINEKRKDENGNTVVYKRTLDWKDIMVITPAKGALSALIKEFNKRNIPCFTEGKVEFKESALLKNLIYLYSSIIRNDDNRYLYMCLKSNLFNITNKELCDAKKNNFNFKIDSSYKELNLSDNLKKALDLINGYKEHSLTYSPSILYTKLIEDLYCFKQSGDENLEYVMYSLELLKKAEIEGSIMNHQDAIEYLNDMLNDKTGEERCPGLMKDGNQVHLANLHKVKGLERPVVILGYPRPITYSPGLRVERGLNTNTGYLFRVTEKDGDSYRTIIETDAFEQIEKKEIFSLQMERQRLAYVAATRAKNVLVIGMCVNSNGVKDDSYWNDLINANQEPPQDIFDFLKGYELEENVRETKSFAEIDSIKEDYHKASLAFNKNTYEVKRPSSQVENKQEKDAEINERTRMEIDDAHGDNESTVIGTMVHRLMELIILSKDRIEKNQIPSIVDECMVLGFESRRDAYIAKLEKVLYTIRNGGYKQVNGAEDDILKIIKSADETYPEVPFTYCENNVVWNGIIDFIYKKDGKYHIIDWKTNYNDIGLQEHYQGQLDAYARFTKEMTKGDVDKPLIYHIDITEK